MTIPAGEVRELLVELIRNRCVNDGAPESGQESRSVETLRGYLGEPELTVEPRPGRRSALWRVPGRDERVGAPRLMLMAHLDVVPADAARWRRDPFGGELVDGVVWGRGAVDMLNMAAAMATVTRRALDGRLPALEGGLLFLAVADEEAGGGLGAAHLVEHYWEEVACEYLLTEVGHPGLATPSGPAHPITVAEKGPMWRRLHVLGTPGHGSQPFRADNAVLHLAGILCRLQELPAPARLTEEWTTFVRGSGWVDRGLDDESSLDQSLEDLASESLPLARWAHACTHLTLSPNVISGGVKANVVADRAEVDLDVRALPGQDGVMIDAHILQAAGDSLGDRIEIEPVLEFPPTASPANGPLWESVGEAFAAITGSSRLLPTLIPVATDARFFRRRGTVAYGIGCYDQSTPFAEFLAMFHGQDERVSEASLGMTASLLAAVVERLAGRPSQGVRRQM